MKPLLRVLNGEVVSPHPVWLMRQAGRYLPEYRALRETAGGFLQLCLTPEWASEITLQPVRRFEMDAAILFSDILVVPYALGQALEYREGEGPVLDPVRTRDDLGRLSFDRFEERLSPIYETVARVTATLPNSCALIGFAGSPWTVAAYMIEGHGGGEFTEAKRMAWNDPEGFCQLIDLIVEATILYLNRQVAAGAEVLQLFDSWAGLLPSDLFAAYVIEPTRRIVSALKNLHPQMKIIGFPRLAGLNYAAYAEQTGVDGLGLDTTVPLEFAASLSLPTQGNLDPILLMEGGKPLKTAAETLCRAMQGKPHIVNLGHGVLQHTNPDHVAQLVEIIKTI